MCRDALHREESCGGHFREEYQTEDGEARRDDERFAYVAAWEYLGPDRRLELHKEPLRVRVRASGAAKLQMSWSASRRSAIGGRIQDREPDPACLAPGRTQRPGRMVRYEAPDISPDMSFLEMLDVVNERLMRAGRDPDRVRPRLPGGHLRLVQPDDQRRGARTESGHRHLPAAHAELS